MTDLDTTAVPTSDLNPFLFANVGLQINGADLSVLSLLARLGADPWTEAARLALLPRAAATDWLAERISSTPLSAQAVGAARETASRLLLLLPARTVIGRVVGAAPKAPTRTATWVIAAGLLAALGIMTATLNAPSRSAVDPTTQGGR